VTPPVDWAAQQPAQPAVRLRHAPRVRKALAGSGRGLAARWAVASPSVGLPAPSIILERGPSAEGSRTSLVRS
jgi:hypothetical protein